MDAFFNDVTDENKIIILLPVVLREV